MVNIHDFFTDKQGKLDAKYTTDRLHLTPVGRWLWKMGWLFP